MQSDGLNTFHGSVRMDIQQPHHIWCLVYLTEEQFFIISPPPRNLLAVSGRQTDGGIRTLAHRRRAGWQRGRRPAKKAFRGLQFPSDFFFFFLPSCRPVGPMLSSPPMKGIRRDDGPEVCFSPTCSSILATVSVSDSTRRRLVSRVIGSHVLRHRDAQLHLLNRWWW